MTDAPLAITVTAFGAPEQLELRPHDPGAPQAGEVRIAVEAAGISYVDVLVGKGEYQLKPPLPFVLGTECAGVVEAVGDAVDPALIGQRVCAAAFIGAFGQATNFPARSITVLPQTMSFEEASVFRVSYGTAYHALVQRGQLQSGETLLVLGAGGAVGCAAVQLGKALGARVVASASSPEKRALALAAGADAAIDARSPNWRDDVKAANDGRPVDIVLDPVGGEATEPAFRSLAWKGRLLVIGFAGGGIAKLPVNLALLKGAALIGVDVRQFGEYEPDVQAANMQALFALHAEGKLRPPIAQVYPLTDYVAALHAAFSGQVAGRIVLKMR
ncbi:NADPH:quinone oxidoreductase family protein [Sphingobium sp. EM0848]|uniref:NADPH:quinone oxidoreductase family protein n=1 Tax=Sphingobium sp. EM0848 TaxID=2743473 RepID=UPI00159C8F2E|nr:NADPH:quinone oxidoreductase family protein [Sphingobium sp. EM0848]